MTFEQFVQEQNELRRQHNEAVTAGMVVGYCRDCRHYVYLTQAEADGLTEDPLCPDCTAAQTARLGTWLRLVTNAPDRYDGGGTFTETVLGAGGRRGSEYRIVRIAPDQFAWHRDRYASGLYQLHTLPEYESLRTDGLL